MTILHGSPISSATKRVRIALGLKGIEHEFRVVDLGRRENQAEAYRAMNPMGQVPTLEIDGQYLTQSIAICEYLDETRPEPPLLPKDPVLRARCRELVEIVNSGIQPLQNKAVIDKLVDDYDDARLRVYFGGGEDPDPAAGDTWPQHWIRKGLTAFERKLADTAGRYCFGDDVTLADVVLSPQVTASRMLYRLDLGAFPTIARVYAALGELEPFAAVRPGGGG